MRSSKKFCLLFGVAVLCFGVVGNVHADMFYMDDPEVTVTGNLGTVMWNGDDNGWDYANDHMWIWDTREDSPLYGTTHKYLMAKHSEDSGLNPVTVELALGNGTYDIGYVWYRHALASVSVGLTVEGVDYGHNPSGSQGYFHTQSVAADITVTDGALTLVFGNTTADNNWFTVGQLDASFTAIPEPSTLILTVFGLIGLAAFIRRRK